MRKQLLIGSLMIAGTIALVLSGNARASDVTFHPAPAVGDVVATFQEPYCDTADEVKAIATAGHDGFESLKAKFQELAAEKASGHAACGVAPSDKVNILSIEGTGIVTASDGKKYQTYAVHFTSATVPVTYWMLLFRGEMESAPAAATKSSEDRL